MKSSRTMLQLQPFHKSMPLVKLCKYNYKDNIYKYVDKYETNSFIFNENEFTYFTYR